jgi:hypothetical protein
MLSLTCRHTQMPLYFSLYTSATCCTDSTCCPYVTSTLDTYSSSSSHSSTIEKQWHVRFEFHRVGNT